MTTESQSHLYVGVTVVTAPVNGIEILFKKPIVFSSSDDADYLICIVVESRLHLGHPFPCKLPLCQCLRPQFNELLPVRETLFGWCY